MPRRELIALAALGLAACGGSGGDVAEINNDWTGNEIKIEALSDEKVSGVVCHMAHFDRSVIDRLRKGDWFENPSDGSINCIVTGPVTIGNIDLGRNGEEVFKQSQSLVFKKLSVRRVYDRDNDALVYLVYSRRIKDGSSKTSIASVPLYGANVTFPTRPQ